MKTTKVILFTVIFVFNFLASSQAFAAKSAPHSLITQENGSQDTTKSLQELIENLKSKDKNISNEAADELVGIGKSAIPSLTEVLKNEQGYTKLLAAEILVSLGKHDGLVLQVLVSAVKDKKLEWKERSTAATALGFFSEGIKTLSQLLIGKNYEAKLLAAFAFEEITEAKSVLGEHALKALYNTTPILVSSLADTDRIAIIMSKALGQMGVEPINELSKALTNKNRKVRVHAIEALASIAEKFNSEAKAATPALTTLLKEKDSFLKYKAAYALIKISPAHIESLVPILEQALKSKNLDTLYETIDAVAELEIYAKPLIAALKQHLEDPQPYLRYHAAYALAKIDPSDELVVKMLIDGLKSKDTISHSPCEQALGKLANRPDVISMLLEVAKEGSYESRIKALNILDKTEPKKDISTPILIELLDDPEVRFNVVFLLAKIEPDNKAVVNTLLSALKHPSEKTRNLAVQTLGNLGQNAASALPELGKALKDENSSVAYSATQAIAKIGTTDPLVIEELTQALKGQGVICYGAAKALAVLWTQAKPSTATLKEALNNQDTKMWAAYTLIQLGETDKSLIQILINELNKEVYGNIEDAAQAISKLGLKAGAAMPALLKRLDDKDEKVREIITKALNNSKNSTSF